MNELSATDPADVPGAAELPQPDVAQEVDAGQADEEGEESQADAFSAAFDAVATEYEAVFTQQNDEPSGADDTADVPGWEQSAAGHGFPAAAAGDGAVLADIPAQRTADGAHAADLRAAASASQDSEAGSEAVAGNGPERPRFTGDDLISTGRMATGQARELMAGPDGRDHFPGDKHETFRDKAGSLRTFDGGFAKDDNTADGTRHEVPLETITVVPNRADQAGAAFVSGVDDHTDAAAHKDTLRTGTVEPLIDRMADAGVEATASVFTSSDANYVEFRDAAADVLDDDTLAEIDEARIQYRAADDQLRASSERLGQLAGDVVTAQVFPDAIVVTGGKDEKGRPAEFDRILYVAPADSPAKVIFIEEKGGTAQIDTRKVTDPADPTGPRVTARQCSAEYVREVAQIDATLAKAIRADPELGHAIQQTVTGRNSGTVQCYLVKGLPNGKIKMTEMLLVPLRLLRETIRLAGYPGGDQ